MNKVILNYNPEGSVFFFEGSDPSMAKIYGIKRVWLSADKSVWTMPSKYPHGLVALRDFKVLFPEASATKGALSVIQQLKGIQEGILEHTLINNSGHIFNTPPYIHQLNSIETMLHSDIGSLLLQMGLGKSFISLHYLMIEKENGVEVHALIFCPKIMRLGWFWENIKYTPDLTSLIYEGTPKQRKKLQNNMEKEGGLPNLIITNYEAIGKIGSNDFNFFKDIFFTHLIVDEASRLKGHDSNRSLAVSKLAENIPKKFLLSGGLTLGNPTDLWMPYHILDPNILGNNWWSFRNKYCKFSPWNKHIVTGYKNLDMLKNKITPFSIILNQKDCLTLPEQNIVTQYVPMTQEQTDLYCEILEKDEIVLCDRVIPVNLSIIKINKLLQVTSGFLNFPIPRNNIKCSSCPHLLHCVENNIYPWREKKCLDYDPSVKKPKIERYEMFSGTTFQPKLLALREIIENIEERKEHIIIWAYFRYDLEEIKEALTLDGTTFVTSEEPGSDRVFQEGKHTAYVGQVGTGIGTTLTIATTMVYYSHSLKLEDRIQSIMRNMRIGQTNNVTVIDLVTKGTIEEQVIELLNKKEDVQKFIHSRPDCNRCGKSAWCFARMIVPYSKHCKLYDERKEAEKVKHIQI